MDGLVHQLQLSSMMSRMQSFYITCICRTEHASVIVRDISFWFIQIQKVAYNLWRPCCGYMVPTHNVNHWWLTMNWTLTQSQVKLVLQWNQILIWKYRFEKHQPFPSGLKMLNSFYLLVTYSLKRLTRHEYIYLYILCKTVSTKMLNGIM